MGPRNARAPGLALPFRVEEGQNRGNDTLASRAAGARLRMGWRREPEKNYVFTKKRE